MTRKYGWLMILTALLTLTLAACGGNDAAEVEQPTPTNTPAPSPTPEPTATPTPEPDLPFDGSLVSTAFDQFDTYRFIIDVRASNSTTEAPEQAFAVDLVAQNAPPAQRVTVSGSALESELGGDALTMVRIEESAYMAVPGLGCLALSAEEAGSFTDEFTGAFDPGELFADGSSLQRVRPNETINGVESAHYVFDETVLADTEGVQRASGDLYIAVDGGYLVRLVAEVVGDGSSDLMGFDGTPMDTAVIEMNLVDINVPVDIAVPEGCGVAGSDYPLPDDAFDSAALGELVTFKTNLTLAELQVFYTEQLAAAGYAYDEAASLVLDTFASLAFSSEDGGLTISISSDEDVRSVIIAPQQ